MSLGIFYDRPTPLLSTEYSVSVSEYAKQFLNKVSQLNWRTYLNDRGMSSQFSNEAYVIVYLDGDELKAAKAESPQLLARVILKAIAKQKKVYWAGAMQEFARINDFG